MTFIILRPFRTQIFTILFISSLYGLFSGPVVPAAVAEAPCIMAQTLGGESDAGVRKAVASKRKAPRLGQRHRKEHGGGAAAKNSIQRSMKACRS